MSDSGKDRATEDRSLPAGIATGSDGEPDGERKRSTLEFLTELDVPTRPTSREMPLPGDTLSEANAPAFPLPEPSRETQRAGESVRAPAYAPPADAEPSVASPPDAAGAAPEAAPRFSWERASDAGRGESDPGGTEALAEEPQPRFSWEAGPPGAARPTPDTAPRADSQANVSAEVRQASAPAVPRVSLAPRPAPKVVEETIEERRRRFAVRIHTCRDAFRLLGYLGLGDEERSAVGRMLMSVEEKLAAGERSDREHGPMKEPERFLEAATRERLDPIDRALTEAEEKLIALDDLVSPSTFRDRIDGKNHSRTVLARYARLLASRHFTAGQRRDRFEWLALRLLTARGPDGRLAMLPKDRARVVLQHLIGGMPGRSAPLDEAVTQLQESIAKLDEIKSPEEFFDGGFYLDAHGYKVSMRDQLLSPDFLYLSVAFSAKVENRLADWAAQSGPQTFGQLAPEGYARHRLQRLLEDQERSVDEIFGAMRAGAQPTEVEERKPPPRRKAPEKAPGVGQRLLERLPVRVVMDRQAGKFGVLALVILAVIVWIMSVTGELASIMEPERIALTRDQAHAFSPKFVRGTLVGSDDERVLLATIRENDWAGLTLDGRMDEANRVLRALRAQGIRHAQITIHLRNRLVIDIHKDQIRNVEP